ncbi:protein PLANT CADMIUM RESISTANCE 10 isoform X1 [Carya illinoinensis]|uniref:protein PLANT CADMIUM RESISTANCE 10 isoform X1 n=1 Tax=Carya illinoinensis TaxID=32201 RepID=UPI001C71F4C5|nr:protein PLANT CADMIUM RESISTANCE 10 isoform X1 [Carya illinoinensis]
MKSQSSYMPPPYVPLGQSDSASEVVLGNEDIPTHGHVSNGPLQWSSGICACFDDMQSCVLSGNSLRRACAPPGLVGALFPNTRCQKKKKKLLDVGQSKGCVGFFCPCFLFGKNAEFLGSGTLMGSCLTHFVLWALFNSVCCLLTDGTLLALPGFFISCYACGYRRALRSKYNLREAPCGDFVTHFFCHLCAICQEYREIHERSGDFGSPDLSLAVVTAPPAQTMESASKE